MFRSRYTLSHTGSVFVRSNVSLVTDKKSSFGAKLLVDINPDSNATKILFDVNITASTSGLLRSTGPCFSDKSNSRGLYIYVSSRVPIIVMSHYILLPGLAKANQCGRFMAGHPSSLPAKLI